VHVGIATGRPAAFDNVEVGDRALCCERELPNEPVFKDASDFLVGERSSCCESYEVIPLERVEKLRHLHRVIGVAIAVVEECCAAGC